MDNNPEEKKDDILVDEEEEIKKILEEAEKAEQQPKQEPQQSKPEGEDPKDLLKWFALGIGIIIILASLYFGFQYMAQPKLPEITGPLAVYDPSEFLSGWKLVGKYTTIAAIPLEKKSEFINAQNLTDVANWEFQKNGESIFVWLRQYDSNESAKANDKSFTGIAWRSVGQSNLAFGDDSKIGIYRIQGNDPLASYVRQNDYILSVAYYNKDGQSYDATNLKDDKAFLVDLTKSIITKVVTAEGKTLSVYNIKV